jgi:hypothetical protein
MSENKPRLRNPFEISAFAIPALLYLAIAVPVAFRQRAAINPDGIIYIRKAQFLLSGHFLESVSGYWSPAISWCVALLLRLHHGFDPLHAIHGVLVIWGFTWVLASCAFLLSILPTRPIWRLLAGVVIAFSGVRQSVSLITPDLLLGTMLMAYLAVVSCTPLFRKPRYALVCGLWAGLGYLCKSYALPFFCLHFPLTLAYRYWTANRGAQWSQADVAPAISRRAAITSLLVGILGFALPALPWVGLLSYKYGHFTISMVYHHNHINVADRPLQETLPDFCLVPPDPYLTLWEGLDPGPRRDWSPFSSRQNFERQIEVGLDHAWLIITDVAKFDGLGLVLLAAALSLLPLKLITSRSLFSAAPIWIVLTCGVYCLGFLVVAFEVRYIVPILLPLGIALCLREWSELSPRIATSEPPLLAMVPLAVIGLFGVFAFLGMGQYAFDSPARPIFAQVAQLLRKKHLDGLFTSSDSNKGVNVAYYLNRKIVLIPYRQDWETIDRELSAASVEEVLVWTDSRLDGPDSFPRLLAGMLVQGGKWKLALGDKIDSVRRVDVYVLKTGSVDSTRPATYQSNRNEN